MDLRNTGERHVVKGQLCLPALFPDVSCWGGFSLLKIDEISILMTHEHITSLFHSRHIVLGIRPITWLYFFVSIKQFNVLSLECVGESAATYYFMGVCVFVCLFVCVGVCVWVWGGGAGDVYTTRVGSALWLSVCWLVFVCVCICAHVRFCKWVCVCLGTPVYDLL